VQNIRVYYHAEEIVYVLQALSAGMTGLFVGLITNYLYDKTKSPDKKLVDIEVLLRKQQKQLDELERLISKVKNPADMQVIRLHQQIHQQNA